MRSTKPRKCNTCGDVYLSSEAITGYPHLCPDCATRRMQPKESISATVRVACDQCGTTFIVANGETVAHRRERLCIGCYGPGAGLIRRASYTVPTTQTTYIDPCFIALGVAPECSEDELKAAYRKAVKASHPDHGGNSEAFINVQNAYERACQVRGFMGQEVIV
jgi:DnaJ-class molecular chaperone